MCVIAHVMNTRVTNSVAPWLSITVSHILCNISKRVKVIKIVCEMNACCVAGSKIIAGELKLT